jgi:hypothetical protein
MLLPPQYTTDLGSVSVDMVPVVQRRLWVSSKDC